MASYEALIPAYREAEYRLVEVLRVPAAERVDFVLGEVHQAAKSRG